MAEVVFLLGKFDLGCGEGVATLFAARQGASVIFTDSEEDKVRSLAQQVEAVARRPFTGLVSDSDPLPLRDACADKLVCMEVLEHVANPARVMDELVRLGRPGAQYLLSVPDPVGEHLQQGIAPADYFRAPNHIHIFSRDDFARLVQDGDPAYLHDQEGPDDMAAHIRSVLTQTEITVPVNSGRLALGTWQGLFLWEHRFRAHRRNITVTLNGD